MAFNIHFNSAIHFSVFNKKITNQMIPFPCFQFKFKTKKKINRLKIKYFSNSNSRKKERKISVLFFIDLSILFVFVYFFSQPFCPQISNRPDFPDVTSQLSLHNLGLVGSHKINKIYFAAALFICEFLCVHAPGLLNSISVIAKPVLFKSYHEVEHLIQQ